jgi:hypothetical protein
MQVFLLVFEGSLIVAIMMGHVVMQACVFLDFLHAHK